MKISTIDPFNAPDKTATLRNVVHQPQEVPLNNDRSHYMFAIGSGKTICTTAALERELGGVVAMQCLLRLQMFAELNQGLDYLQVFQIENAAEDLWIIEDGASISALLPSDY